MLTWLLSLALALSLLAAAVLGVSAYGKRRWADTAAVLVGTLEATQIDDAGHSPVTDRVHFRELQSLPAPVQRYFRAALTEGQPIISALTVELVGTFNLSPTSERWKPFTSRQRIVTCRPGFLWDAEIVVLPGLAVRVLDAYIGGRGMLRAAVLGLFQVAALHGDGEIARGELFRFFAEAAWYPTALLPSQGVRWDAIDDHSAYATLVDGPLTLRLLFRFDDAGLIDSVRAEARGAMVGREMVMIPWEARWSDYRTRNGMTVPNVGEVEWLWPEGRRSYFRGTVTSIRFEFLS
ncbi:DUF6920 family protein [Variovorax sp. GT1P44]|uniref:DUF6920 family protein n=1 Tax=Variovorax sp. GT1P44 TaxID=3443742 RepID=UPI003F48149E